MSVQTVVENAVVSFLEFTVHSPTEKLRLGTPPSLADYIHEWVVSGEAVHACHGDFDKYLMGVVGIVNEWLKNPERAVNYVEELGGEVDEKDGDIRVHERRVTMVFRENQEHYILDCDFFAEYVFRTLHPRSSSTS